MDKVDANILRKNFVKFQSNAPMREGLYTRLWLIFCNNRKKMINVPPSFNLKLC